MLVKTKTLIRLGYNRREARVFLRIKNVFRKNIATNFKQKIDKSVFFLLPRLCHYPESRFLFVCLSVKISFKEKEDDDADKVDCDGRSTLA